MKLRKATLADGPAVVALYREAQAFLAAQGIDQWQDGYPNEEKIGRASCRERV